MCRSRDEAARWVRGLHSVHGDRSQAPRVAGIALCIQKHRTPQFGRLTTQRSFGLPELGRHHPDHRVRLTVDTDVRADDAGIPAVAVRSQTSPPVCTIASVHIVAPNDSPDL